MTQTLAAANERAAPEQPRSVAALLAPGGELYRQIEHDIISAAEKHAFRRSNGLSFFKRSPLDGLTARIVAKIAAAAEDAGL
jgi:hypothetical protein